MKDSYGLIDSPVFSRHNLKNGSWILSGAALLIFVFNIAAVALAESEYSVSDVDSPPKIIRQTPVSYPDLAKKNGITGSVIVNCLVGVDGKPKRLEIVKSEPEGIFDENALSSLKYWQFRPGIKDGELVATWVMVPFRFD